MFEWRLWHDVASSVTYRAISIVKTIFLNNQYNIIMMKPNSKTIYCPLLMLGFLLDFWTVPTEWYFLFFIGFLNCSESVVFFVFYWIFELFRQCGIFCFLLDFWTVPTEWYFLFLLDFWTVPKVWYFLFFIGFLNCFECGIFCFLLDFWTVSTVWYFFCVSFHLCRNTLLQQRLILIFVTHVASNETFYI